LKCRDMVQPVCDSGRRRRSGAWRGRGAKGAIRGPAGLSARGELAPDEANDFIHRLRGFGDDPRIKLEVVPHAGKFVRLDPDARVGQRLGETP